MTEIMIKILFDVLCPLLVSVICFQIQYREQIRNDKKELFPPMHAALFDGKEAVCLHKDRIAAGGKIVELIYKEYEPIDNQAQCPRSSVEFKEITYEELMEKADRQELLFMQFGEFKGDGINLTHFIDKDRNLNELDFSVVSDWISDKYRYCFVCRSCDVPFGIRGKGEKGDLEYRIIRAQQGVIYPQFARRKRGR